MKASKRNSATPNRLLHHDASTATLVTAMKLVFTIWLLRFLFDPFEQISQLPVDLTAPVSFLAWLPRNAYEALHSFGGLLTIKMVVVGCSAGVWIPKYRMPCALVACITLTIACAITRGFGHINHAEIGPLLVTWILTIYALRIPIEEIIKPNGRSNQNASTAMIAASLVFGLCYSLVGITRLTEGGMEVLSGKSIPNRMLQMSHHDWVLEFNFANFLLSQPWMLLLLKLGTAAITVFEIATPLCLVSSKFRKLFLLVMPGFHFGAILLFKIDFIENVAIMFVLYTGVAGWLASQRFEVRLVGRLIASRKWSSD